VNESILKQTICAKTFILPRIPLLNRFGTNSRSRKVAYSLTSWNNQFEKNCRSQNVNHTHIISTYNFGTNCRSRKVAYSLMSWMNQFWNKLYAPKRLFYPKYLYWTSLVQTLGAEKRHTPWSREIINFEKNCRSPTVNHTHIISTYNFGTNCRSRKVAYSLISWNNQFWKKL